MTLEPRIRDALAGAAGPGADAGDADDRLADALAEGVGRRRRRTAIAGTVAALLVVAGLAGTIGDDAGQKVELTPAPAPSTTEQGAPTTLTTTASSVPAPTSSPTTIAPADSTTEADRPATAVALSDVGRVVVLDTASGKATRTLATHGTPGPAAAWTGLSLTPDRATAYYGYRTSLCEGTVYKVPTDGSTREAEVVRGMAPEVDPRGRRLAYVRPVPRPGDPGTDGTDGTCSYAIVVRDLTTGTEKVWTPDADGFHELAFVANLRWSPGGDRLGFDVSYEGGVVRILDPNQPGGKTNGQREVPSDGDDDVDLLDWLPDGRIVTASYCCYEEPRRQRTVIVDPDSGKAEQLFDHEVALDADATGRHLLYVDVKGDRTAELRMRSGDRDDLLGTGFQIAEW